MFHLAGLLHARGFAVTVFHTDSNAPDPSSHLEYDFVAVPDGMPAAKQDVVKVIEHVLALNRSCEEPFRERLAALLGAPGARDDVACLVADSHLLTLMDVARQLGVPTLALRTGSAASVLCFAAHQMLCEKGYLPPQGTYSSMFSVPSHCVLLVSYLVPWQYGMSLTSCFAVICGS
jgi:hypothetical protein